MATRIHQTIEQSTQVELETRANENSKVEYWDKYCKLNTGNDACRLYDV